MDRNISDDYIVRYLTQTEGIRWRIDNQEGGYYAVVNDVLLRLKGDNTYLCLTIQGRFPEVYYIAAGTRMRFYSNEDIDLKELLKLLFKRVQEQIFPDPDQKTVNVLENQSREVKNELWAKIAGWDKKT